MPKILVPHEDVESITSIGDSTKRDDPTAIGKFGVGFKAVFAYTDTPEIHSGSFHFRIQDLVVPVTNGVPNPRMELNETRFEFPFDNAKKQKKQAVAEIEKGLRSLSDSTLLFLTHIRIIEYLLPDGSFGSIQRIDGDEGRIEIHVARPDGAVSVSHWLRFQKDVDVQEGKDVKKCGVAIAFHLIEDDAKGRRSKWKIVPIEKGEVSIFFPAEKETTNLRFHLHAPFASTVARDSVRDTDANDQLRDHLAELIVESLEPIRDQGMLTVGFLASLPNPEDNLAGSAPRYEPIREALIKAFQEEYFTPTKLGGHAPSVKLYKGPVDISRVLDDDDLSFLTNHRSPLWSANAPQANQREDRFLESLEIEEWSWRQLSASLRFLTGFLSGHEVEKKRKIEKWIAEKDETWLMRFYALLGMAVESHYQSFSSLSTLKIIRVSSNVGVSHVIPKEAFFPLGKDESPPLGVHLVKHEVFNVGRSDSQKRLSKLFLEKIGVRPFNPRTEIEIRLQKYDISNKVIDNDHYDDIKAFLAYWKSSPTQVEMFKSKKFLLGGEGQDLYWSNPNCLCLDEPYLGTNLSDYSKAHGKRPVYAEYWERFGESPRRDFVQFLKAVGVMTELTVSKVRVGGNPMRAKLFEGTGGSRETNTCINVDSTIENIEVYLSEGSLNASQLVWNAILRADKDCVEAKYRPNQTYELKRTESQLVHCLKKHPWIPDRSFKFHKPSSISKDELPISFPYDGRNGILTAIGFGEEANKRSDEYKNRDRIAKEFGLDSADDLIFFANAKKQGVTNADIEQLIASKQPIELPVAAVPNPERRRKQILISAPDAPSNESVVRERSIQVGVSEAAAQAKAYLRAKYSNENNQVICQCCDNEMPFKLLGGAYYFEAVQYIPDKGKRHFQNRIALCPLCAAMYQYARSSSDDEMRTALVDHESKDDAQFIEIPVVLAGKQHKIRFVGTHWFDLKNLL